MLRTEGREAWEGLGGGERERQGGTETERNRGKEGGRQREGGRVCGKRERTEVVGSSPFISSSQQAYLALEAGDEVSHCCVPGRNLLEFPIS